MLTTPCEILKAFPFSRDGVRVEVAQAGETVDIPARLVDGLTQEGYVRAVAAAPAARETKVIEAAPEAGAPVRHVAAELDEAHAPAEAAQTPSAFAKFDPDGDGKPGGAPKGGNRKAQA